MRVSALVKKLFVTTLTFAGLLFYTNTVSSQSFQANFNVHVVMMKVYLYGFYGEKIIPLDSAVSSANGEVTFLMGSRREPGIYRISVGRQQFLDFIYNRENISVDMELAVPGAVPKATSSNENDVFYKFLQYDNNYHKKLNVLLITGSEYPENDEFYQRAHNEYLKLIKERKEKLDKLIAENKGTLVANVLAVYREPELDWSLKEQERKKELKAHYFDNFTLKDSLLIRTNILTSKAIDYLTLYANPNMTQSEVETQFITGIDVIMAQLEKSPAVYEFMISYLVGGFEKYKMEKVLVHLYEKYLSGDHCPGDVKQDELSRRLKAYEQLAIGKVAPEISSKDKDGKPISLTGLNNNYYLLVFYASWCPHCHDLLTNLPELSKQLTQQNIGVITVTMDTIQATWKNFLLKNNLPWINTIDGGGWNGPTVRSYNIYATPTMFLVDRQRKIIAKPITFNELKEEINRISK